MFFTASFEAAYGGLHGCDQLARGRHLLLAPSGLHAISLVFYKEVFI